jgi:hypothetical protein
LCYIKIVSEGAVIVLMAPEMLGSLIYFERGIWLINAAIPGKSRHSLKERTKNS